MARYCSRISGPLLERIDLVVEVGAVAHDELAIGVGGEAPALAMPTSAAVRTRATRARAVQLARQGTPNARLAPRELERHCAPDAGGTALVGQAMARLSFSARTYHRVLRVARTIADLAGASTIAAAHVAEALAYRGTA